MRSLRTHLMLWMFGGTVLLVLAFGLLVYGAARRALVAEFDASTLRAAETLAALIKSNGRDMELKFDDAKMPQFGREDAHDYFQLWLEDGAVFERSHSLGPDAQLPYLAADVHSPRRRAILLPSGRPGRAVSIRFRPKVESPKPKPPKLPRPKRPKPKPAPPPPGHREKKHKPGPPPPGRKDRKHKAPHQSVTLAVARDASKLAAELRGLRSLLAWAGGAVVTLALVVVLTATTRGLRPLTALARQIASIRGDDLARRLETETMPAEVVPVGDRLNALLGRLEEAFARERAFTDDVAHELRTPVAGLRAAIEVALSRPRRAEDYKAALTECLTISRQLELAIQSLLMLARLETGQAVLRVETLALCTLVDTCWRPFAGAAAARGLAFHNDLPRDLACAADRQLLERVISEALENASQYTNQDGTITVAPARNASAVEVRITNSGCTLTQDQVPRVFDRFWRGDAARTDAGVHCGLGLALVQKAMGALGGSASARLDARGFFSLTLLLPEEENGVGP